MVYDGQGKLTARWDGKSSRSGGSTIARTLGCGSRELNEYLERSARENHESGGAKTFAAVSPAEPTPVLGYYSISPGAIEFARAPARLTRKLGRYEVPVFRLGRLAVALSVHARSTLQ